MKNILNKKIRKNVQSGVCEYHGCGVHIDGWPPSSFSVRKSTEKCRKI